MAMFDPSSHLEELREQHSHALRQMLAQQQAPMSPLGSFGSPLEEALTRTYRPITNVQTRNPTGTLALIKKSIKEIKAEAVSEEAQGRVEDKILRLLELGATAQATVLEAELSVRRKLNHLQEWDYKVLPYEAIEEFEGANRNWDGQGGRIKVHIDPLESYCGNPQAGDAKDRIIPDNVLDKLEEAKERKLFDTFSVLWVEKVADPLLLGIVNGCKDYFFITEWGSDISFEQIMKNGE